MWVIEYTDEFNEWWETLTWEEQAVIDSGVKLLEELGPALKFPHSSSVE